MKPPPQTAPGRSRQCGTVLTTSLIILVALTILGLAAMQTTSVEERMAGNLGDQNLAFQATETGLRAGEDFLRIMSPSQIFDASSPGLIPPIANSGAASAFQGFWTGGGYRTASTTIAGAAEQPRYVIEELPYTPAPTGSIIFGATLDSGPYRITARGVGSTASAVTHLQTTFRN